MKGAGSTQHLLGEFLEEVPAERREAARSTISAFIESLDCAIGEVVREDLYWFFDDRRADGADKAQIAEMADMLKEFFEWITPRLDGFVDPFLALDRGIPKCLGCFSDQGSGEQMFDGRGLQGPALAEDIGDREDVAEGPFRALYIPHARSFSHRFLKQALLLFDELWFLDPLDRLQRTELCYYGDHGRVTSRHWARLIEVYDQLFEAGFVRVFSDFRTIRQHDVLLFNCLRSDLADSVYTARVSEELGSAPWYARVERLPKDFDLDVDLPGMFRAPERTENRKDWYASPQFAVDGNSSDGVGTYEDFTSPYVMYVGHCSVDPRVGFSANLNQCLLTCALRGLAPVADSPVVSELLRLKLSRLQSLPWYSRVRRGKRIDWAAGVARLGILAVGGAVPLEDLEKRTYSDLLRLREAYREQLSRFQERLRQLRAWVEHEAWSPRFDQEVALVLERDLQPQIRRLRDELRSIYVKLFRHSVTIGATATTSLLALCAIKGFDWAELLAWGATVGTGLSATAASSLVGAWQAKRETRRNAVYWLIQAGAK